MSPVKFERVLPVFILLGCLTFGAALASYAFTGTTARLWADDYCYNAALNVDGFWGAQVSFYQTTSDRYSVIPLVGVSEWFGPQAIRAWPLAVLLLSLGSLTWLLGQAACFAGFKVGRGPRFLLAEVITFFALWQAPNLFQVFYWRTGMLTYFMPLVVNILLAGLILWQAQRGRPTVWKLAAVFLLAFFAAGFSETTSAMQAGALALALLCALIWGGGRRASLAALLSAGLLGALAGMVVLFVSPSNQLRLVHMPQHASLPVLVTLSLRFGLDFIKDSLVTQPLPSLVSLLFPFALGLAWQAAAIEAGALQAGKESVPPARKSLIGMAVTLLVMYFLVVCVCAPSVYVEVAYPEPRALIAARLAMVLGLALIGWQAGALVLALARQVGRQASLSPRLALILALVLLGLTALYPLRATQTLLTKDLPYYQQRAAEWDVRDREIRAQAAQGSLEVQVRALDSIAGLMELQTDPGRFPNSCAAGAYGLRQITGVIP